MDNIGYHIGGCVHRLRDDVRFSVYEAKFPKMDVTSRINAKYFVNDNIWGTHEWKIPRSIWDDYIKKEERW